MVLSDWIQADPYHRDYLSPDFFYDQRYTCLALENHGCPGLFLRMDPEDLGTIRLHIQFGTNGITSAITMLKGWPIFLDCIQRSEIPVARLIFESTSPSLISFCKDRLGFQPIPGTNDYELFLEHPNGRRNQEGTHQAIPSARYAPS